MFWIAWRMLVGNPGKYLGIVMGVAFAAFLIAQQASVFVGLINLTSSQIRDVRGVDFWVCNPGVKFVDDNLPMTNTALGRIRGVPGVEWAVPLFKGLGRARMPDGSDQQMIIMGLDNGSFVGARRSPRIFSSFARGPARIGCGDCGRRGLQTNVARRTVSTRQDPRDE